MRAKSTFLPSRPAAVRRVRITGCGVAHPAAAGHRMKVEGPTRTLRQFPDPDSKLMAWPHQQHAACKHRNAAQGHQVAALQLAFNSRDSPADIPGNAKYPPFDNDKPHAPERHLPSPAKYKAHRRRCNAHGYDCLGNDDCHLRPATRYRNNYASRRRNQRDDCSQSASHFLAFRKKPPKPFTTLQWQHKRPV
jgi:hypothetical protein